MAWRTLVLKDETWNVTIAAELRPNTKAWQLVLAFRNPAAQPDEARSFWAPYPIEATSKAALFAQAERIPNAKLQAFLVEHTALR